MDCLRAFRCDAAPGNIFIPLLPWKLFWVMYSRSNHACLTLRAFRIIGKN